MVPQRRCMKMTTNFKFHVKAYLLHVIKHSVCPQGGQIFKQIIHFTIWPQWPHINTGYDIYNFGRDLYAHHYFILSLSAWSPGVQKKIFKELKHFTIKWYYYSVKHVLNWLNSEYQEHCSLIENHMT